MNGAAAVKKKYCTIRLAAKEKLDAEEKLHPIAFFVAKTTATVGGKVLLGIATAGLAGAVSAGVKTTIAAIKQGADAAIEMRNIQSSPLTVAAKFACSVKSAAGHLQGVFVDGAIAFVEEEAGVDISGSVSDVQNAIQEVDSSILTTSIGLGMTKIKHEYDLEKAKVDSKVAETFGFDCTKLCMLDTTQQDVLAQQDVAGGQTVCALPDGLRIGKFICQGGGTRSDGGRNAIACTIDDTLAMKPDDDADPNGVGVDKWIGFVEGQASATFESLLSAEAELGAQS
jgi:hypothetical protein